jgi:F-type H+-transporting ATPase subunit b
MAASSEAEQKRILTEARVEATRILSEQRDFASKFRVQAEAEAKASAERIVVLAKTEIDAAAQQASAQLRRDAAELSVEVAERILRHKLDEAESKEFAERLMSEVAKN